MPGQIAAPLWLDDDRQLAFIVDRDDPGTMTLWLSTDGGSTWPVDSRLVVYRHRTQAAVATGHDPVDFAQYWEDMGKWSFGHPALLPLDGGRVLAAWYAGDSNAMSLHCARIKTGPA
jgi:hypothetical protein